MVCSRRRATCSMPARGVKRVSIRAPSQMFEEWSRRPGNPGALCQVSPQLQAHRPWQLIGRMNASRRLWPRHPVRASAVPPPGGHGLCIPDQVVDPYASLDHPGKQDAPEAMLKGMLPANWTHHGRLSGWLLRLCGEVLALDTQRLEQNAMDTTVGSRYRKLILGKRRQPIQPVVEEFSSANSPRRRYLLRNHRQKSSKERGRCC